MFHICNVCMYVYNVHIVYMHVTTLDVAILEDGFQPDEINRYIFYLMYKSD